MVINYSNIADIQQYWLDNIAPKYWEMDDINQYKIGAFGYINELMAVSDVDNFNSTSIARREFYPNTAQYDKSFYKMAALHSIDLPIATPAVVDAALMVTEEELLQRSTVTDGVRSFTIDSEAIIMADQIQFMLDYPIKLSSQNNTLNWAWTAQYVYTDSDGNAFNNTLHTEDVKYLPTKTITQDGMKFVVVFVPLRQLTKTVDEQSITVNHNLDVVTIDIPYKGQLANFEVFYTEDDATTSQQLKKVLLNSHIPQEPFCMYSYVDGNKLRIHFPSNAYFMPKFNSSLKTLIYTTEGTEGNFSTYDKELTCSIKSNNYPYNNQISLLGITMSAAIGGVNTPDKTDFKDMVCAAYATNNCNTSENDLQIYFDRTMKTQNNKIVFFKKRDDVFERLYGAFMLMKDSSNNVVPSNTIHLEFNESNINGSASAPQIGEIYENNTRIIIKPSNILTYKTALTEALDYSVIPNAVYHITDKILPDTNALFLYTNPYLIAVSKIRNSVGYFLNSCNSKYSFRYTDVNDASAIQFLATNLSVYRNAIIGEDFYKITMRLSASSSAAKIALNAIDVPEYLNNNGSIIGRPDKYSKADPITNPQTTQTGITATKDGYYKHNYYLDGDVFAVVQYTDNSTSSIKINSTVNKVNGEYVYSDGYFMNINRGDTFKRGDILAYKRVHDKGTIRNMLEFTDFQTDIKYYIPLIIESYDEEQHYLTLSAYIRTNDQVASNNDASYVPISGFYKQDGNKLQDDDGHEVMLSVPIEGNNIEVNSFIRYDTSNLVHSYADFNYVADLTWTNEYKLREDQSLEFIKAIDFLRSSVTFPEVSSGNDDTEYKISQIPLLKAVWARKSINFEYALSLIQNNYNFITKIYNTLENNFSIDMKFFNTYGKSKFYKVGFKNTEEQLYRVDCTLKFGVKLNTISPSASFKTRFIAYVKDFIESLNDTRSDGKSIYIMNLISELKTNFAEIDFIEYYGMDSSDDDYRMQRITSLSMSDISNLGYNQYIPEFINIRTIDSEGIETPQIEISIL